MALTQISSDQNTLGVFSIPDSNQYVVLGIIQGRAVDGFDCIVEKFEDIGSVIQATSNAVMGIFMQYIVILT